jgi:hypothetical protein
MSEEHLETLIKTMEISNTTSKKEGVAGDMEDFWDDCVDSKNTNTNSNVNNKKQIPLSKKFNNNNINENENEEELPEDYITCNY